MKDQNISIIEIDSVRAIMDIIAKCHNTYVRTSRNKQGAETKLYIAYRWLFYTTNLVDKTVDHNTNFGLSEVSKFNLLKHGPLCMNTRQDYPVFIMKALVVACQSIVEALQLQIELGSLNKTLYQNNLSCALNAVVEAKFLIELDMEISYQ